MFVCLEDPAWIRITCVLLYTWLRRGISDQRARRVLYTSPMTGDTLRLARKATEGRT